MAGCSSVFPKGYCFALHQLYPAPNDLAISVSNPTTSAADGRANPFVFWGIYNVLMGLQVFSWLQAERTDSRVAQAWSWSSHPFLNAKAKDPSTTDVPLHLLLLGMGQQALDTLVTPPFFSVPSSLYPHGLQLIWAIITSSLASSLWAWLYFQPAYLQTTFHSKWFRVVFLGWKFDLLVLLS